MSEVGLKREVFRANLELARSGLVIGTFGNVSGIDRRRGLVAIKPSGVAYERLTAESMVVVSLATGEVIDGRLRPSSDLPTHLELYRAFANIGGVAHTHSLHATAWAQAGRAIPALGTTHADHFPGPVPCTRPLRAAEIRGEYERNTGLVIVECLEGFAKRASRMPGKGVTSLFHAPLPSKRERGFPKKACDPFSLSQSEIRNPKSEIAVPAVLVANHGPFAWGVSAADAVENAIVLEYVAALASQTLAINPDCKPIASALLDKHFGRKHGPGAYYGQKG